MSQFTQLDVDRHNAKFAPKVEQPATAYNGPESDIHDDIAKYCESQLWYYVRSRTDKKTTQQKGVPDFIIAADHGITIWCEVKRKGNKLRDEQAATGAYLKRNGHIHWVVYSYDEFLRNAEGLKFNRK